MCEGGWGKGSCSLWPGETGLTLGARAGRPRGSLGMACSPLFCSASSLSLLSSSQVVFPPGSPVPLRRTFSVLASSPPPPVPLLQQHKDASASSPSPSPSLPAPSSLGPSALARGSPGVPSAVAGLQEEGVQGPTPPPPAPHTWRSVGCQTDEDLLFPPMQAGLSVPVLPGLCPHSAHLRTHTHTHTCPLALCPQVRTVPQSFLRLCLDPGPSLNLLSTLPAP